MGNEVSPGFGTLLTVVHAAAAYCVKVPPLVGAGESYGCRLQAGTVLGEQPGLTELILF